MTTQTIDTKNGMNGKTVQSVREELEKGRCKRFTTRTKEGIALYCNDTFNQRNVLCDICKNNLKAFNLGVSLAQKEFLDKINELNDSNIKHWEYHRACNELKKSLLEDKSK